jgi:tetratricopeptide (TPR) repeat protein
MANKNERRRRKRQEPDLRRENPYASPRSSSVVDWKPRLPVAENGGRRAGRGVVIVICCLLVLGCVTVYVQTAGHGFVNCDDNEYVYDNHNIQRGLTPTAVWWAITQAHSANWHPLTWITHILDWWAFGTFDPELQRYVNSWPGGHHLVNLLLHAVNAVLLFLVLQALTGATWPSALAAALFAIHPLRVESVAWATERKDTLSGLFFLLTLAAYRGYAVRPFVWWRYALVFVVFIFGLTAKSMLVTLPLVLLLLDYWPLRRIAPLQAGNAGRRFFQRLPPRVLWEKLPLLALSAWSCAMTVWAQTLVAAFKPLDLRFRVGNALVSYAAYLGQMFYPAGMVVQYVHPGPNLLLRDTLIPAAVLAAITLAVGWLAWRRRYLAVGWLWYLGMLVPVIGLVQVGAQARADRYTYLTQIGLYIMIAWGLSDLLRTWRGRTACYAAAAVPILALLTAVAWMQTTYWRNSLTLWQHSVACQGETNDFAQNEYGQALADAGREDEAWEHYVKAVAINPLYLTPRINCAVILQKRGKSREALTVCDEALQVDPEDAQAHHIKAVALFTLNQPEEAIREFQFVVAKNPQHVQAHNNLAEVLRLNGRYDEALVECRTALELNPEFPDGHRTMAHLLLAKNDLDGALGHFQIAMKLKPDDPRTQEGMADILWRQGKFREAVEYRKRQVALQPQNVQLAAKVARDLINDPRPEARFGAEALEIARRACEATEYKDIITLEALAGAYAETGDFDQAEAAIRKAMETTLGQRPNNAAVLRNRLAIYHAHQKPPIPPPTP